MTLRQELASWAFPPSLNVAPAPESGQKAPTSDKLKLPQENSKPVIITFLRHCGCPWAEKTFRSVRDSAAANPEIQFIAVSHSDESSTQNWLDSIGGPGNVRVIVDSERDLYAQWGLGAASFAHLLSPWAMANVYKLGKEKGIWNKPTESGSRWQTAGTWAVDASGVIKWGGPASRSDECPDVDEAVNALKGKP